MTTIQLRRGNASEWSSINPLLRAGEVGVELDTSKFKLGNGVLSWNSLEYFAPATALGQEIYDLILDHINAPDPHPQYSTDIEVDDKLAAHVADPDPHPVYATDADLAAHVAAPDPHPQYTTEPEVELKLQNHVNDQNPHPNMIPIGSGHIIRDEGVQVINRASLNFVGGNVEVLDDVDNNMTNVVISGGGAATIVAPEPPDPTGLPEGTLWVDEDSTGPAGGGGGYTRKTVIKITASIAANATISDTITLAAGYKIYRITASAPCRFRMYTEAAKRDADLTRSIGVDPTGDHGLQFEFVATNPDLTFDLTPLVDGFDGKSTPDGIIPISVTNMTAGATPITVDLLWIRTE
jgi:hypothetical protein